MLKSMTGYGSAKGVAAGMAVRAEIRCVNSRYLDLNIKLPRGFLFAEDSVKALIQQSISRGKVDFFLNFEDSAGDVQLCANTELAGAYVAALRELETQFQIPGNISAVDIARFPDVLVQVRKDVDQELFVKELSGIVGQALADLNAMREREGEKLKADLFHKADDMEALVGQIEVASPETLKNYRSRLEAKLADLMADQKVTQERIIMEAAVFADRIATDEETVRLRSHLSQYRAMLSQGSPIGRKLDFLIQEFNREANTIGSKCQDSSISYLVVSLKSEIEKAREQIQNIE